jgi:hypothetical protein
MRLIAGFNMRKIINIALIFVFIAELMPPDAGAVCLRVPMGVRGGRAEKVQIARILDGKIKEYAAALKRMEYERNRRVIRPIARTISSADREGELDALRAYDSVIKKMAEGIYYFSDSLFVYPLQGSDMIIQRHGETFPINIDGADKGGYDVGTGQFLLRLGFGFENDDVSNIVYERALDAYDIKSYELMRLQYPKRQLILILKGYGTWNHKDVQNEKITNVLKQVVASILKDGDYVFVLYTGDINRLADANLLKKHIKGHDAYTISTRHKEFVLPDVFGIFRKQSGVLEPIYMKAVDISEDEKSSDEIGAIRLSENESGRSL